MPRPTRIAAICLLLLALGCDEAPPEGDDDRGEWAPSGKADEIASCVDACGGKAAAGCWCDDQCKDFGDCCPDVDAACHAAGEGGGDDGAQAVCTLPSDGDWSCGGLTGKTTNPDRVYFATSFGCWVDDNGNAHGDAGDNCIPACTLASIGCSGMSGPQCERSINWYTADADRFGCGAKLHVTNPDNGKSAVLMAIDRGPNCRIEKKVDHWVLDISTRASMYFFGGQTAATERADLLVEVVDASTPLGPTAAGPSCG